MAKPEKHVFICTQARPPGHPRGSCSEKGCGEVAETFWFEMQERNLFDRFAVTTTGCIGPCGLGPNMLVYPEGIMYNNVSKADVPAIVEEHLLGGQPVERLFAPADVWGE